MDSRKTHRRIRALLAVWEEFDQIYQDGNLNEFGEWLIQGKIKPHPTPIETPTMKDPDANFSDKMGDYINSNLNVYIQSAIGITQLARQLRQRTKQVLAPLGFGSADEFHYMASLYHFKQATKTELIQAHNHEITTGTEIIRRLVKLGWLSEKPHHTDGRAKIVEITPDGISVLEAAFVQTSQNSIQLLSAISEEEVASLAQLLAKVEHGNKKIVKN